MSNPTRTPQPTTKAAKPSSPQRSSTSTSLARVRDAEGSPPGAVVVRLSGKASADPRFQATIAKLELQAGKARKHRPASQKSAEAQGAAQKELTPREHRSDSQRGIVGSMNKAPTSIPKEQTFLEVLEAALEDVLPKKVEGTKHFMEGDDRSRLEGAVKGNVQDQKKAATQGLQVASSQIPQPNDMPARVVSTVPVEATPALQGIQGSDAMPQPKPETEVSLEQSKRESDLAVKAIPTDLRAANDPRFSSVLSAQSDLAKSADTRPVQYRALETQILERSRNQARQEENKGLAQFRHARSQGNSSVHTRQLAAVKSDADARQTVVDHIEGMFTKTKDRVVKKLLGLEAEVLFLFDLGVNLALTIMHKYVEDRFDDRYGGWTGWALWLKDKVWPLPDKVKKWFADAYKEFRIALKALIVSVAGLVEKRLNEAKTEIKKGEAEVDTFVTGLPGNLTTVGRDAQKAISLQFNELRQSVDSKKQDLASSLVQKYQEAIQKGDQELQALKDAHKSLVEKLADFLGEVWRIINEFKDKLIAVLKKGWETVKNIVFHPIRFLENLLKAVVGGFQAFGKNFPTHLEHGLMDWLSDSFSGTGIQIPKDLSLPSIFSVVAQVLGLTYDNLRARARLLFGERNTAIIEKVTSYLQTLFAEGPKALWEKIQSDLSNLKDIFVSALRNWLVKTVVEMALKKLAMMFTPAGAIIQALLTIIDVIVFLWNNLNRILGLVEAVIDSIYDISRGAVDSAIKAIENALVRLIPMAIDFFAQFLKLKGIVNRIRAVIEDLRKPVNAAIDRLLRWIAVQAITVGSSVKKTAKSILAWWKRTRKVGQGSETHTLLFKGDETTAELYIHSSERLLTSYLDDLKTNTRYQGTTKKAALTQAEQKIPIIKKLRTEARQADARGHVNVAQTKREDIDKAFDYVGDRLNTVFASDPYGTEADPIPLDWLGPATNQYPSLYFGGKLPPELRPKTQATLKGIWRRGQKDVTGTAMQEFKPNERKTLPGGETIGLLPAFRLGVGTKVGPLSQETTAGGSKLERLILPYGYNATEDGFQLDHVHEIQFGGLAKNDQVGNLWPLQSSLNSAKGSGLAKASIEFPKGVQTRITMLKIISGREFWFKVKSVKG